MNKKQTGVIIATVVAGLVLGGHQIVQAKTAKSTKIHCMGVNSCKGKGACKSADNACKGQNSCKGKGMMMMSEKKCTAKGGTVMKDS